MIVIRNNIIPFDGWGAMNILGLLFVRKDTVLTDITLTHEAIHSRQQYELLMVSALLSLLLCNIWASWWYVVWAVILPILIYFVSFLLEMAIPPYHNLHLDFVKGEGLCNKIKKIGKFFKRVWVDAYYDNCFEREAFANERDPMYLVNRRLFAFVGYIIKRADRK